MFKKSLWSSDLWWTSQFSWITLCVCACVTIESLLGKLSNYCWLFPKWTKSINLWCYWTCSWVTENHFSLLFWDHLPTGPRTSWKFQLTKLYLQQQSKCRGAMKRKGKEWKRMSLQNQMCVLLLLIHKKSLHLEGICVSQVFEGSWTKFCCVEGGSSPSTTPSNPQTPAGYLRTQLTSDTVYLEMASDSTGKGFSSTRLSCTPHFRCQVQAQAATCASDLPATDWRFQWPPP